MSDADVVAPLVARARDREPGLGPTLAAIRCEVAYEETVEVLESFVDDLRAAWGADAARLDGLLGMSGERAQAGSRLEGVDEGLVLAAPTTLAARYFPVNGTRLLWLKVAGGRVDAGSLAELCRRLDARASGGKRRDQLPPTALGGWLTERRAVLLDAGGHHHWHRLRLPDSFVAARLDAPAWTQRVPALRNDAPLLEGERDEDVLLVAWLRVLRDAGILRDGEWISLSHDQRSDWQLDGVVGPLTGSLPVRIEETALRDVSAALDCLRTMREEGRPWAEAIPWEDAGVQSSCLPIRFEEAGAMSTERASVLAARAPGDASHVSLVVDQVGSWPHVRVEYAPSVLSARRAERLLERLRGAVESLVCQRPTFGPFVSAREQDELRAWGAGRVTADPEATFLARFRRSAEASPDATAILSENRTWTYSEVDRASDAIASALESYALEGEVVPVVATRRAETICVLLAILKARAAFVPIDPSTPPARAEAALQPLRPSCVIVGAQDPAPAIEGAVTLRLEELLHDGQGRRPTADPAPDDLAYVMLTSGSTGTPKGVEITHAALLDYVDYAVATYWEQGAGPSLVHTSLAFDLTITSVFASLCAGAAMRMVGHDDPVREVAQLLRSQDLGALKITPAHLEAIDTLLPDHCDGSVSALVIGGEQLYGPVVDAWRERFPSVRVFNEYGPTEATVGCVVHEVPRGETSGAAAIPIGRPCWNTVLRVVDDDGAPVPVGKAGELWIGGRGLARGYRGDPQRTAERFVADGGERFYRTGDLVRYRDDGVLDYIGRTGDQRQVRGHRIELGDVEAALRAAPGVSRAAVVLREEEGTQRAVLAGFYVTTRATPEEEIESYLSRHLPAYAVPHALVEIDEVPLTPNGKVDGARLEQLAAALQTRPPYAAPRGVLESALAAAFERALGVERVGRHDRFRRLGGDSIVAMEVAARLARVGIDVTPQGVLEGRTLHETANAAASGDDALSEPRVDADAPCAISHTQQRFLNRHLAHPHDASIAILRDVSPDAEPLRLAAAWQQLHERHEVLRLGFERRELRWAARLDPQATSWFRVYGPPGSGAWTADRVAALCREASAEMALDRPPLARFLLGLGSAGKPEWGLMLLHHLVADGVSVRMLTEDFFRCCADASTETVDASYRRVVAQLTGKVAGGEFGEAEAYWRARFEQASPRLPRDGCDPGAPNIEADHRSVAIEWPGLETRALLSADAPADHLLLAAIARAVSEWTGASECTLGLELHGRQIPGVPDAARVVGPLNLTLPLWIRSGAWDRARSLAEVERARAQAGDDGVSLLALRYLREEDFLAAHRDAEPELVLNYLGQFQTRATSRRVAEFARALRPRSLENTRPYLVSVRALVEADRLRLTWDYCSRHFRAETIESVAATANSVLRRWVLGEA